MANFKIWRVRTAHNGELYSCSTVLQQPLYYTITQLYSVKKNMNEKKFRFGKPVGPQEMPKPRKRLPQYDECLKEFLSSGHNHWEVDIDALPSQKPRVVLSSLKWRVRNNEEYKDVRVIMSKNKIYLEREK